MELEERSINSYYTYRNKEMLWDGLTQLQKKSHALAKEKGFYDPPRSVAESLCLIHEEISEAAGEYRRSGKDEDLTVVRVNEDGKPEGFPIELADAMIRLADLAEALGISLCEMITLKHEYNITRSHRHGNKRI